MAYKAREGFLLTTKLYKSTNYTSLLTPEKKNLEGKAVLQPEGTSIKKQENTTTRKIATRKIYANELHAKLGHNGEDKLRAKEKHQHYIIKGALEVFEDCTTVESRHKPLHKVAEEHDLNPGKMVYLYLSSQKKPSYGGSNNWILIQDSDTRQK